MAGDGEETEYIPGTCMTLSGTCVCVSLIYCVINEIVIKWKSARSIIELQKQRMTTLSRIESTRVSLRRSATCLIFF